MEQVSRMAAEVNKLIGRNLLDGNAVFIPEVGSLYVITNAEGNNSVDFSSTQRGTSLIDIVQDRAACTPEQAAEIVSRWGEEVRNDDTLKVEGVGELRGKTFVLAESFSAKLNQQHTKTESDMEENTIDTAATSGVAAPTPSAPKKPTPSAPKKSNKGIIIAIIVILAIVGGYFGYSYGKKAKEEKAQIEAIAKQRASEQQRIADSIAVAQIEARRMADAQKAAESQKPPRYRVVYGVYSLRSNVDVAIKKINKQFGDGSAHEYPFTGLTMVSMFESDDRAECQRFLMENYDEYSETWVHDSEQ